MNNITVVGIDLAKNVFQIHAEDQEGNKIYNRQYKRRAFEEKLSKLPPCLIGMEACGTAHHWARKCLSLGHQVKLINPKKVKAFLDINKTDAKDAEAICDATRSKKIRAIPIKTLAQQDLTTLHKARSQVVSRRTQIANHLRSQLAEYGIITRKSHAALMELVREMLEGKKEASSLLLFVIADFKEEFEKLSERKKAYDQELTRLSKENKSVAKLMTMPGIGEVTATALVAKIEDFSLFKKGRDCSAWLGLTPKESSSAEKKRMGKMSKKGDRYVRMLLIHGARAEIRATLKKNKTETAYHRWIQAIVARIGKNKAAVALANKHVRMIWALMKYDRKLDLNFAQTFNKMA